MAFTFGRARDGKKTMAAGSPPAGACSASKTMSDVPSVLVNMRSRPDVSQFVRSTVETTAERSAVGRPTLRAGAARGASRCNAQATPANAARNTTLIGPDTLHRRLWLLLWLTRCRRFGRLDARECSPRLCIGAVRCLLDSTSRRLWQLAAGKTLGLGKKIHVADNNRTIH